MIVIVSHVAYLHDCLIPRKYTRSEKGKWITGASFTK